MGEEFHEKIRGSMEESRCEGIFWGITIAVAVGVGFLIVGKVVEWLRDTGLILGLNITEVVR